MLQPMADEEPAADWQSSCITSQFPLKGKDFAVVIDQLMFSYSTGLTGRFRATPKGKKALEVKGFTIVPSDVWNSWAADDIGDELADWKASLATQTFAQIQKLGGEKLRAFQPLDGAALAKVFEAWKVKHYGEAKARAATIKIAVSQIDKRFADFSKHVKKVWGFEVPRSLVAVQAFFESTERSLLRGADLTPAGVLERLGSGGLARKVLKGKDERMLGRYFRDPAELLTFAETREDGLHFGLWFDDTVSTAVVLNYARDTAESIWAGETPMTALIKHVEKQDRTKAPGRGGFANRHLVEIMTSFQAAEAELMKKAPSHAPKVKPPAILGGMWLDAKGKPSDCELPNVLERALRSDPKQLQAFIKEAQKRLKSGDARMMLAIGRGMHWLGGDYKTASGPLLASAYEALGRKAQLGISRAHYEYRDDHDDVLTPANDD